MARRKVDPELSEKQRRAVELRKAGLSYDRVAELAGYSNRSGAWKAVKAVLERNETDSATEMRVLMAERLDTLFERAYRAVLEGDLSQIKNCIAIEKRRADLFGLDTPKQVEVAGPGGGAIQTDVGSLLYERIRALSDAGEIPNVIDVEEAETDEVDR